MKKLFIKVSVLLVFLTYGVLGIAQTHVIAKSLHAPTGIAFNHKGDMLVTNWSGNSIVKITPEGKPQVIYSGINAPAGIVVDANNNIYVASYQDNYILKIDSNGHASTIASGFRTPTGMAWSNMGDLLVTNRASGEIIAVDIDSGTKKVIATNLDLPVGVTQLSDGSLVVSQYSGKLTYINTKGDRKELGASFNRPGVGIVTVSNHLVGVIDNGAGAVRLVNVETGETELLAQDLEGAVALAYFNHRYYVGTWNDGQIHVLTPRCTMPKTMGLSESTGCNPLQ